MPQEEPDKEDPNRGYFEEYGCGCVSEVVRYKRELLGYCGKHGHGRRHVHRVHPCLDKEKWEDAGDDGH